MPIQHNNMRKTYGRGQALRGGGTEPSAMTGRLSAALSRPAGRGFLGSAAPFLPVGFLSIASNTRVPVAQ